MLHAWCYFMFMFEQWIDSKCTWWAGHVGVTETESFLRWSLRPNPPLHSLRDSYCSTNFTDQHSDQFLGPYTRHFRDDLSLFSHLIRSQLSRHHQRLQGNVPFYYSILQTFLNVLWSILDLHLKCFRNTPGMMKCFCAAVLRTILKTR